MPDNYKNAELSKQHVLDDLMGEMGFTDEAARLAHTEALLSDRPLALVVLGMHRSGTSALTRVLSLSGLTLPQDLMTPAEDNPDGFWESDRISHFNNRLLEAKGTYWDDPFSFSAEPRGQALLRPYVNEGVDLLREDFPGNLPIVFKDPRLSLLAPFWHEVLDRAGYTPRYVISMRHPAEIARSLAKRDGFALQKSYLLWFNYMLSIERDTRMLQRCFVAYDDLLSDWPLTLDTIEKKLHIRFDRRDPAAQNAIQAALKTDLRHHNSNAFNRSSHAIPAWIQYINTQMSAPGFEAFDDADPKLKQLVTRYTQQRVFYGPILSDMESRISHQQAITKELEAKMLQSSAAYEAELASRIDELQQERTQIETLLTQIEEQETALAHLRVEISDRNQALERKSDALSQSLSQISQMQLSKDEMQAGYEAQNAEYEKTLHEKQAGYEAQIAHYENTLHEMQAGYEAQNAEYEKTLHEKQAERTHALSVIESLQVELKREQTVSLDRHRNLVSVSTELNAIRSSKSWRITRIPRAFGARLPNLLKRPQARIEPPYNTGFTVPVTQQAAPPIKSSPTDDKFTNAHTAAYAEPDQSVQTQLEDATAQSWKGFDPSPVAEFLRQRDGREAGAQAFIKQCRTFALPYETDQTDKPELCLSDQQARDWIHQVKTLSQDPFHKFGQADISIILPVYNQLPFTLSALASVYTQKTSHHFEIILADDASTDQTQELGQAGIQNLHISRTEGNLGFLGNVNQAAKKAQGKYIVLLNNDTIALDGWLDALIGTLESDPGIGLVGSQLIFPSGRLQEAGGIVWRDGSAWNYGRNEDPQDPRYAFARDVDYCSGASIALPRALWEELGGFDGETYLKAYYEDTDLAFRVREAGYRVRYQPRSALVHFEGASSGMDLSAGQKQYQVENEKRFFRRWKKTLSTHRVNADNPVAEANRTRTKNILIIDAVTPTPDKDAGSLVTVEMISALQANGYHVSFIPEDNFAYLSDCSPALLASGVQIYHWPFYKSVDEVLEFEGHRFDAVLIFRVTCASKHLQTVRKRAPQAKIMFHVADLHHLREIREAEIHADPKLAKAARKTERLELQAVEDADLTIVHSQAEQSVLAEKTPDASVYLFPWIAEPTAIPPAAPDTRSGIVFVGGFRHTPNVQGIAWFVSHVWPKVREARPDQRLQIIGADAPDQVQRLHGQNGIEVVGWVPKLEPYFQAARLSVAPLLYGAGVKGKVISAFCEGLPVVGTHLALEGLPQAACDAALIADEADAFAKHIIDVIDDDRLWLEKSRAGMDYVAADLSRARGVARIAEMEARIGLTRPLS